MSEHRRPAADAAPALPKGAAVVIAGGGVTGLSAGWWLARSGVDVLVLDKGIVGWEASGRNGGGCSHYQSPLYREEQRLWPQMDELLGYPTEYRRERLVLAVNEAQWARARYVGALIRGQGFAVDELDSKAARDAIPLAGPNAIGAIHTMGGGHANPQRTVQAYHWAFQDLGGRVLQHTPVLGIDMRGGRVVGVRTSRGEIACEHLVVAAGPQAEALLAPLGLHLPLAAARAEMIVTEPLPLMRVGGTDGNDLYGRQTLRGNLAYGGGPHEWVETEASGPRARPASLLLANLSRRLAELFPGAAHARVIRSWAGIVENTPDGCPVIDRPTAPGNLTICTMSGVGFGLSPATGHAIRDLVIEGTCSFADLGKLSLGRFRDLPADWRHRKGWRTPMAGPETPTPAASRSAPLPESANMR